MSLPKPLPNCPRVRTAYMAPDGGCCSAEWVFDSPRVVELAELFHTLDEGTISTFGTPTQDESTTGIALWVRFLAFVRGSGVNVHVQRQKPHRHHRPQRVSAKVDTTGVRSFATRVQSFKGSP